MPYFKTILNLTAATLFSCLFISLGKADSFFSTKFMLRKSAFTSLPNWQQDQHAVALFAFQKSCKEILRRDPNAIFGNVSQAGKVSRWQTICSAANVIKEPNNLNSKMFFEKWFDPYLVKTNYFNSEGLFTGYYLPVLKVSYIKDQQYNVPIYGVPDDLIKVDLQTFYPQLNGKFLIAKINNKTLTRYPDRAAINRGAIDQHASVLLWCDNIIDLFFAQIQGSAIVQLPDGKQEVIGYAASNGRDYTSIGRILVDTYHLDKDTISMQTIRTWLLQHPREMHTILNQNASYVFFRVLSNQEPLGTEHVALTPGRSLAVDTRFIPLGAPVWLDTTIPANANSAKVYQHLLVAQDTGGSIKGIIRGDVYWGTGEEAAFIAGYMKHPGRYWLLLPK